MTNGEPLVPRYGEASLAEVVPSLLAALGVTGFRNALEVEPVRSACVLVVDGLGWEQLLEHRQAAPFLAARADGGRAITAGFPSTTAASLGSLGTGLPPGEHGLVGYTVRAEGLDRPMNLLRWELYGAGPNADVLALVPPESFQPSPTALERARAAGMRMRLVGPPEYERSGLTRAILRGAEYLGATALDDVVRVIRDTFRQDPRAPVCAYHPFLDTVGHLKGAGTDEWLEHLARVDGAAAEITEALPAGAALFVTSDHGMVNLRAAEGVDLGDEPDLLRGVEAVAGEARARHVYARPGAEAEVLAAWRERLGSRMWIRTREGATAEGWFGPRVLDHVRPRIGDVVAAAHPGFGVFHKDVDALQAMLVGHHGSLTAAEQLVPFLEFRR